MDASTTLRLDNTPFAQAIDQAETKAKTFSSRVRGLLGGGGQSPWRDFTAPLPEASRRVEGLSGKITDLFKRSADKRAEVALSEFAANLATGNVATAVTGLGARISGFGLAAGIAVGAAIAVFQKFKGQVDETTEAEKSLRAELSTIGFTRGPEEATKKLAALKAEVEDLATKSKTAGSKFANFLSSAWQAIPGVGSPRAARIQSELREGLTGEIKLMRDRVEAEEKLTAIKETSVRGSEQSAELAKIDLDLAKKRGAIFAEAQPKPGTIDPLGSAMAIRRAQDASKAAEIERNIVRDRYDVKSRELGVEQNLANMARDHVSAGEQAMAAAQSELGLIQDQLNLSRQLTEEQRAQLLLAQTRAQTKVSNLAAQRFFNPGGWEAQEVGAAQERERLKVIPAGFEPQYPGQMPSLDMSGNLIPSSAYKTSPEAYGQTGGRSPAKTETAKTLTKQDAEALFEKYWGK